MQSIKQNQKKFIYLPNKKFSCIARSIFSGTPSWNIVGEKIDAEEILEREVVFVLTKLREKGFVV